jgi:DNA-directed RNA polymerase sigma subunit (sigma70/sigma32)
MNRRDIEEHIDGQLALLCVDRYDGDATEPMSRTELAKALGVSRDHVRLMELELYNKLKCHPGIWEAVTSVYRTPPVIE